MSPLFLPGRFRWSQRTDLPSEAFELGLCHKRAIVMSVFKQERNGRIYDKEECVCMTIYFPTEAVTSNGPLRLGSYYGCHR